MRHFPCGICGASASLPVLTRTDKYGRTVHLVVCATCGVRRLDPRTSDDAVDDFYEGDYYRLYAMDDKAQNEQWVSRKRSVAAGILDAVEAHRRLRGARLLDIGCGHGFLIAQARARGAVVAGIEPSRAQADALRVKGFEVFAGNLAEFEADAKFDVITLSHVVEHVAEPVSFLASVKRVLAPDGLICAEVPNTVWQTREGYHPLSVHSAHLYYHSERTLRAVGALAGFRTVQTSFGMNGGSVRIVAAADVPRSLNEVELDVPSEILAETLAARRRLEPPLHLRLAHRGVRELKRVIAAAGFRPASSRS